MDKSSRYKETLTKAKGLLSGEKDFIANMANIAALIKSDFNFWWVGFYLVKNDQLVLGPFQGPVACTRIDIGKGVCGKSWQKDETIIVADVHQFEGHIACSEYSNSEIVIPIRYKNNVIGVFDIDSENFNQFDETDSENLKRVLNMLIENSDIEEPILKK